MSRHWHDDELMWCPCDEGKIKTFAYDILQGWRVVWYLLRKWVDNNGYGLALILSGFAIIVLTLSH